MHDINDERNQLPSVVSSSKECIGCMRMLPMLCFPRDASYRDGRRDLCEECANAPRMTTAEHVLRLREQNANSEAVKKQRWEDQDTFRNEAARQGKRMSHSDFLLKLQSIRGTENLYITEGRIVGDLAVFKIFGRPQPHLEGRTFEYLFYIPTGIMPEYSLIEFSAQDVPVREKQRGWRTVLLRLIKSRVIKEDDVDAVFGRPNGPASYQWRKQLHLFRSQPASAAPAQ